MYRTPHYFWSLTFLICLFGLTVTGLSTSTIKDVVSKRQRPRRHGVRVTTAAVVAQSKQPVVNTSPTPDAGVTQQLSMASNSGEISLEVQRRKSKVWTAVDSQKLMKQITRVAFPALAAAVVEPALTMIDMYFVGTDKNQLLATAGLAGLSVTGAVFNVIAACTYPLCSGTTAVVSRAQGTYEGDNPGTARSSAISDKQKRLASPLGDVLINGLMLGLFVGTGFAAAMLKYSSAILAKGFTLEPEVLGVTNAYIKIRGAALPFALINYVLIGFCLAVQDATTPLLSIAASSIVNIIGDYLLVSRFKMGLVGAAAATAFATAVSAIYSLVRLLPRYVQYDKNLSLSSNIRSWCSAVDVPRMKQYFETSLALLAGMVANTLTYSAGAKISTYSTGSSVAGSRTVHVAGHQIAMQIWWFLSYFSTPLSYAAQAILPRDLKRGNIQRVDKGVDKLLRLSFLVAVSCTVINIGFLLLFPNMFTSSSEVQNAFRAVLPQVAVSQFLIDLTTTWDGILIGTDRVGSYIAASVLSTAAAWVYYSCVATKKGLGIVGTWNGLVIFAGTRVLFHLTKMLTRTFRNYNTKNTELLPADADGDEVEL